MSTPRARALLLALVLAFAAAPALADKLILTDGRVIRGKIMGRDARAITFGAEEDGQLVVRRYLLSQVKQVIPELEGAGDAEKTEKPKKAERLVRKVVFLLDVSGSMAIGDRLDKARAAALAQVKSFRPRVRVQFYSYSGQVVALQRDYRNCVEQNLKGFENLFKRLTVNPRGTTDIVRALRAAFTTRPDAIYIYTDGVQRSRPGQKVGELVNAAARLNTRKVAIHVRLFQDGRLPYLAGEPLKAAEDSFKKIAEASGGSFEISGGNDKKRAAELGAELQVLDLKGKAVDRLVIGGRYRLRLAIKGFKPSDAVLEYLSKLPILARSVDASGKDVVRRKEVPLEVRNGILESLDTFKVVGPNDTYRGTVGYMAAAVGGKVAVFFDGINGRFIQRSLTVSAAPPSKSEDEDDES